ncbi:MAG: cytochrome c oxidase accessory protein CcoG [Myxococcales bacterium]|nr:cytochrome c oxidase accessory protein CcoG [Myxococcales bacterium]
MEQSDDNGPSDTASHEPWHGVANEAPGKKRAAPSHPALLAPREKVLSTLNQDGTRNWIRPKLSKGKHYRRRLFTAWGLIALFAGLPYLTINGKPAIFLNIMAREFTFFGTTFFPTDNLLLLLLLLSIFLGIFLFTALFGRVWCGWACPQTVYMEYVFRPIERLIEGPPSAQKRIDKQGFHPRRLLKTFVFLLVALGLAHIFLSYFVGVDALAHWVRRSPFEHPVSFLVMASTTALIFFDFAYFREQTCLVACPYGRFQSVLLDRKSLIVGYDYNRGEPRGKKRERDDAPEQGFGDCIDCKACVVTCPTGIDIRDGLQMECINCTQCIDACDDIMAKVQKPLGLIRYTSQDELENADKKKLRLRVFIYPALMAVMLIAFIIVLTGRTTAEVTILRSRDHAFQMMGPNEVANIVNLRINNRTTERHSYTLSVEGHKDAKLIAPNNPMTIEGSQQEAATIFIVLPKSAFVGKTKKPTITLKVVDGQGFEYKEEYPLTGPDL